MQEVVLYVITQAALILTTLSFLAPLPSCTQIWRNGCTGDMDISPFLTGAIATFSWLRYGWVINDPVMIRINIIGFSAYTGYVVYFYLMCFAKRSLLRKIGLVVISVALALYMIIASNDPAFWSGMMAIATSLTFITSPLASVSEVMRTKSTESLPFCMILFNFLVGALWTLYGYLIDNYFLIFPNGLGSGLSVTQLCLFLIYPSRSSKTMKMHKSPDKSPLLPQIL